MSNSHFEKLYNSYVPLQTASEVEKRINEFFRLMNKDGCGVEAREIFYTQPSEKMYWLEGDIGELHLALNPSSINRLKLRTVTYKENVILRFIKRLNSKTLHNIYPETRDFSLGLKNVVTEKGLTVISADTYKGKERTEVVVNGQNTAEALAKVFLLFSDTLIKVIKRTTKKPSMRIVFDEVVTNDIKNYDNISSRFLRNYLYSTDYSDDTTA